MIHEQFDNLEKSIVIVREKTAAVESLRGQIAEAQMELNQARAEFEAALKKTGVMNGTRSKRSAGTPGATRAVIEAFRKDPDATHRQVADMVYGSHSGTEPQRVAVAISRAIRQGKMKRTEDGRMEVLV